MKTSGLAVLLFPMVLLSTSCAMTFDLVGGPRNERITLEAGQLDRDLGRHVADSAQATRAFETVQARRRAGTGLMWSGLGLVAVCVVMSQALHGDAALIAVSGSCGATLVVELVALIVLPKLGSYADVLRAFNRDFPATPWSSRALEVGPAERVPPAGAAASL